MIQDGDVSGECASRIPFGVVEYECTGVYWCGNESAVVLQGRARGRGTTKGTGRVQCHCETR